MTEFCVDNLRHYSVVSPEMSEVIPILDDGTGPLEYWCAVAFVLAQNKRDAKIKAIQSPDFEDWVDYARSDNVNPFTGLKVELVVCEHGVCWGCVPDVDDGMPGCESCRYEDERGLSISAREEIV